MSSKPHREGRDRRRQAPAFFAALTVCLGLLFLSQTSELPPSPNRIALPHREAGLSCESCHRPGESASSPCRDCHGEHRSRREAHARLAERGELSCNRCHDVHGQDAGIRWSRDEGVETVFYTLEAERALSGGAGVGLDRTLPLVSLSVCESCHQLNSDSDPISRCLLEGVSFSLCFDEHQGPIASPRPEGVCREQHGPERPWLWEAAANQLRSDTVGTLRPRAKNWWWLAPLGSLLAFAGHLRFSAWRARRRTRITEPPSSEQTRRVLPVIDQSRCLGCGACVDVCAFDVLRVDHYVAFVARPEACCGAVSCAEVCPNGSLSLSDGELKPARQRLFDEHGASLAVPGVYVAGDATGTPLIKNAIVQGERVTKHIASSLTAHRESLDLLIVGAGPAGISAALTAKAAGLRYRWVEQGSLAERIRNFPRGKLIFDQPLQLPSCGPLWFEECTKEELLQKWLYVIRREQLPLEEGRRLVDLTRRGEALLATIQHAHGGATEFVRSARVLLSVGRGGSPRKLGAPIEEAAQSKVHYHLADARSFSGKRVVIVGLGDVAVEAAIALARQAETGVTLLHRGAGVSRAKERNQTELARLLAAGRVRLLAGTEVVAVHGETLELREAHRHGPVPYDALFVMIGSLPRSDRLAHILSPENSPPHDA